MEEDKKDYLITITGRGKRRQINLSPFAFNAGIFMVVMCVFIFIGTCGYSVYSALYSRQNTEIVRSVQRAAEMQQEQLLTISKKAVNLSETIQNLAQQEEELRIQAGLEKPAKEDKVSGEVKPEDEIPELGEIAPIEGLPTPEELPALENIPSTVEIPAPTSQWISPESGGYGSVPVIENPAPTSNWIPPENGGYGNVPVPENPIPTSEWGSGGNVPTENPAPTSNWISPENGGYGSVPATENPVPTSSWGSPESGGNIPTENPAPTSNWTPPEVSGNVQTANPIPTSEWGTPNSNWTSPENGGYTGSIVKGAMEEISEWISPEDGGYVGQVQPVIVSQWISPESGGYSGQVQPVIVSQWISPEEGGYVGQVQPVIISQWISPESGGYSGQVQPVIISQWISPDNGGYVGTTPPPPTNSAPKQKYEPLPMPEFIQRPMPIVAVFPVTPSGQGGPLPDLELADVSEALSMIEERVAIRLESLDEFQAELKARREQLSTVVAVPSNPVGTYGTVVIDNGFASDINLNLGQFGGSPLANPNVPSIWPTTGVVTSPYGLRWGGTDFHPGIDIANDMGTPIVATADGVVEYAGWNAGGYGNMVDINHGNGLMTRYGHASQVVVTVGQSVKRGQLIAYMGSTGFSTGPHCHYEVHVNGQRVNPISYL